ncbi:hypothetical protein BSLG_004980, partial [Batrachochytrium salamandrivorans]
MASSIPSQPDAYLRILFLLNVHTWRDALLISLDFCGCGFDSTKSSTDIPPTINGIPQSTYWAPLEKTMDSTHPTVKVAHDTPVPVYTLSPVTWVGTLGNSIPANAIVGGQEADGLPLYIARGWIE